jgi:hypothetical protein
MRPASSRRCTASCSPSCTRPTPWTGPGPAWMPPTSAQKKGGEATGPSPVDRAKTGSKHHLICDGNNTPFKVITTAANGPPSGLA